MDSVYRKLRSDGVGAEKHSTVPFSVTNLSNSSSTDFFDCGAFMLILTLTEQLFILPKREGICHGEGIKTGQSLI